MGSLVPLVSLSILACIGILIQAGTSNVWLWAVWGTINGSATIGDLWITAIALRYPAYTIVVDEKDGMWVFLPRGNSVAPHLHLQVNDGRDPLDLEIREFVFTRHDHWTGQVWETSNRTAPRKGVLMRFHE